MNAPTMTATGAPTRMAPRDWAVSALLHASLLGAALWWGLEQAPAVERLEVAVRWAAPPPPAGGTRAPRAAARTGPAPAGRGRAPSHTGSPGAGAGAAAPGRAPAL